jgi:hypothetical protein
VERLVTVVFGPARSTRFATAVAEAERGPGICSEIEPGRYRACFLLDRDAACYRGLARLLERVRHWRATEVYDDDDEPVSVYHARDIRIAGCPTHPIRLTAPVCGIAAVGGC